MKKKLQNILNRSITVLHIKGTVRAKSFDKFIQHIKGDVKLVRLFWEVVKRMRSITRKHQLKSELALLWFHLAKKKTICITKCTSTAQPNLRMYLTFHLSHGWSNRNVSWKNECLAEQGSIWLCGCNRWAKQGCLQTKTLPYQNVLMFFINNS
jgi:hypothetical protein